MQSIFELIKNSLTVDEAENKIYIWSPEEIAAEPSKADVWIMPFLVGNNAPVSIICPGGAYAFVSHGNEGAPLAEKLNQRGHNAFVLNYRVAENARYPHPMEDLARAIQLVRKYADSFNVDGNRLSIWGSSAAGHLCGYFSARYGRFEAPFEGVTLPLKPQATVLVYPVISFAEETHSGTRDNLLGENSSLEERADKSCDLIATEDYPPCFLFHCEDDNAVPISNSYRMAATLEKHGVNRELYTAETGGHGCGVATGTAAQGWIDRAIDFIEKCY